MLLYNTSCRMPSIVVERSPVSIPKNHRIQEEPDTKGILLPPVESRSSVIGYRLPKKREDGITGDADKKPDDGHTETATYHKLWSRHGYDYYDKRKTRLAITSARTSELSPRQTLFEMNKAKHLANSHQKFDRAVISPTLPPKRRFYAGNVPDSAIYKHMLAQTKNHSALLGYHDNRHENEQRGPLNTPMPRHETPTAPKSAHSIRWALSPYRNIHVDKKSKIAKHRKISKGHNKAQGPYSREFTVTCSTPNNWLRMKLGRSKTMMT